MSVATAEYRSSSMVSSSSTVRETTEYTSLIPVPATAAFPPSGGTDGDIDSLAHNLREYNDADQGTITKGRPQILRDFVPPSVYI